MPDIFVNTTNNDIKHKLFNGLKAGTSHAKAEEKMQKAVKRIVDKAVGFTTDGGGKGYAIKLMVDTVQVTGMKTKCSLKGFAVRHPPEVNAKGQEGEVLATGIMAGTAVADGTTEGALLDCIDSLAEDMATKAIPAMREDFTRR